MTSTEVNPGDYQVWLAPSGMLHGPFGSSETNGEWLRLGEVTIVEDQPPYSFRFKVSVADCRRALGLDR